MSELAATHDIVAAPSRVVTGPRAGTATLFGTVKSFAAQPAVAKSLPLIGLVALLGIAALIWAAFAAPPGRELFRGLPDGDKAAVAETLKGAGIGYEIDRDTGALSVGEDDYYQAKMLLAAQGLPKSAPGGAEAVDSIPLGASRAVEGERLRGARELDLARTIEAIDAVAGARVHIAVEEESAFVRDRPRAAASVMLRLEAGRSLSEAQVQAIVHLVASSVPGLSPEGVSVVDQNGRLLSSEGNGTGADASERQVAVQSRIEDKYRKAVAQLLTPIVGAGNFTAEVHADVDFSEVQATREGFPKEATAVTSEQTAMTTDPATQTAGGIPGALANQPPPAAQVAMQPNAAMPAPGAIGGTQAGATSQNVSRSYAVGREVSVTRQQIGTVKRLTVAVALKNPEGGKLRPKEELAALEALVKGAVGFDQARGDMVALSARTFAPVAEEARAWWEAGWVGLLSRNLTALAVAALVVFGLARPLMKRGTAALAVRKETAGARPELGGQIAQALTAEAAGNPETRVTLEMIEAAHSYEHRAALIRNFVRQDPARAALVVRDLIKADAKDGE